VNERSTVVVTTKHENGNTTTSVGLTGSMRRFLHVLRRREDGISAEYSLKPNEKKILAMFDAGLIELRLTNRGRMVIQQGAAASGDEPDDAEIEHGSEEDDEDGS
jgi:hypothetical protein